MRRRSLLASVGASIAGSIAGCLGDDASIAEPGPLEGRHQWGYDARNSNDAAGLAGPTDEPSQQALYTEMGGVPLTDDGILYTSTAAIGFDGERLWDSSPPVEGSRLAPAIYEDTVVCAGSDPELCWAIDRADGTERWQVDLSASVAGRGLWVTVQDDNAYFATGEGVGCVDLDAREEAWQADLSDEYPFEMPGEWLSPAATAEHVFTLNDSYGHGEGQFLYGLDRETGTVDWTAEIEGEPWSFRPPLVGSEYAFVVSQANDPPGTDGAEGEHQWTQIAAVDPGDGEVAWRTAVDGTSDYWESVGGGTLFLGHGKLDGPDSPGKLSAVDTSDGTVEWTVQLDTRVVSVTATDEMVYALDSEHVRAFDRDDGDAVWSIDLVEVLEGVDSGADLGPSIPPLVVDDGRLFFHDGESVAGLW